MGVPGPVGFKYFVYPFRQQAHSDKAMPTPPVMVIEMNALKMRYAIASSRI